MDLSPIELWLLKLIIWTVGPAILGAITVIAVPSAAKAVAFAVAHIALFFHDRTAKRIAAHYSNQTTDAL